jgi:hypothetical protein
LNFEFRILKCVGRKFRIRISKCILDGADTNFKIRIFKFEIVLGL